jgi:predicted transcriptional regulator
MRKVVKAARPVATSVRFDPAVKAAIDKAAKADTRSTSSLIQKIIADWLKANGFLK